MAIRTLQLVDFAVLRDDVAYFAGLTGGHEKTNHADRLLSDEIELRVLFRGGCRVVTRLERTPSGGFRGTLFELEEYDLGLSADAEGRSPGAGAT